MHVPFQRLLSISVLFLLSTSLFARSPQNVWIVDDTSGSRADFFDLQPAVDAAGDGDVLLVKEGTYEPFRIDGKSLTVVAERDASVQVLPDPFGSGVSGSSIRNLGPNQDVVLRGLELTLIGFGGSSAQVLSLHDNAGLVWIEDCSIQSSFFFGAALSISHCAGVHVVRSTLEGGARCGSLGKGLDAVASNLALWESSVRGGEGCGAGETGPAGLQLLEGTLFAAGCTIEGGQGSSGTNGQGGNGGDGLILDGGATARVRDCTLLGGSGGSGMAGTGDPGTASTVLSATLESLAGENRGLAVSSPVQAGIDTVTVEYTGIAGDLVYLLWSYDGPMAPLYLSVASGSLALDLFTLDGTVAGTLAAGGNLSTTLGPLGTGGLSVVRLPCQALFIELGAGPFLSGPSHLTIRM